MEVLLFYQNKNNTIANKYMATYWYSLHSQSFILKHFKPGTLNKYEKNIQNNKKNW